MSLDSGVSALATAIAARVKTLFTRTDFIKERVKVVATGNLTLSGEQTINGVACVTGDRVFAPLQTTGSQNGLYIVASGAWSRSTDFDTAAEANGAFVVDKKNGAEVWYFPGNAADTLGTTLIVPRRLVLADSDGVLTAFLPNRLKKQHTPTTDWDVSAFESGFYCSNNSATGVPVALGSGGSWTGVVVSDDVTGGSMQHLMGAKDGVPIVTYVRYHDGSNWEAWVKIPTTTEVSALITAALPATVYTPPLVATFVFQGALTVRSGVARFIVPTGSYTIAEVRAVVVTANTGAAVLVDVNKNGTTIYSGGTGRPSIPVSTALTPVTDGTPSTTTVSAGDLISVDIDQIGSTIAGADLTVEVELVRTA